MRTPIFSLCLIIVFSCMGVDTLQAQRDPAYKVVVNHEEQYSVWPIDKTTTKGWKDTKIRGTQIKCQAYIQEVWTDMRPLSIRNKKRYKTNKYQVVINHEEQYSVWPQGRALPKKWKALKVKGTLEECTAYIKGVWTDMRPLSLRKKLKK